ncbi:hypothetical protein FACS189462_2330 [Spirochaetia bacterium]|nr:hypothetical protein FACS189462_2330 [Spirochaetia bacterium]
MQKIDFTKSIARKAKVTSGTAERAEIVLDASGGGISLEGIPATPYRYIVGSITVNEDHSVAMLTRFFTKLPDAPKEDVESEIDDVNVKEAENGRIRFRFGLLPRVKTQICFDLHWLDNGSIYTNQNPGTLKTVVHGLRTPIKDVVRVELGVSETFHDVHVVYENFYLTNEKPKEFPLPDIKLVDEFGQWKPRDWPGKIHSFEELKTVMKENEGPAEYQIADWNKWGGDSRRKLKEGTGFFSTIKTADGRWHLTDPDGCDYFSLGPCGTRPGEGGRVDYGEKFCDSLPDPADPKFKDCYDIGTRQRTPFMEPTFYKMFNFCQANIRRVYGDAWREKWEEMSCHLLMSNGVNSQGNFPGLGVNNGRSKIPYVRQIAEFPGTAKLIFRDFPDVFSPEYAANAEKYAARLEEWKDDPWLIGYFLRNEPEFNFVPNLAIADEVLHNPEESYCKKTLIEDLKEKYSLSIDRLNAVWGSAFASFEDLNKPVNCCSVDYPGSKPDINAFSTRLIREYVRIPAEACRKIDRNHLNLGLRWSKADNPGMMAGWEYFDVFSINCYSFDPTNDMDFVVNAGVDLPIIMGEFHAGALDRGLPATGLKGVANQDERAVMYRHFVEKVAAHPCGVGAHWFQYNDQHCLGRFDGENYQIGMVDVCMRPHKELMAANLETAKVLYKVRNGETPAYNRMPKTIPMIGY